MVDADAIYSYGTETKREVKQVKDKENKMEQACK